MGCKVGIIKITESYRGVEYILTSQEGLTYDEAALAIIKLRADTHAVIDKAALQFAESQKRSPGRHPCTDEIQLMRAIEAQDETLVPEGILSADYAWLNCFGFIGALPGIDIWNPTLKHFWVTPKGKEYTCSPEPTTPK